MKQTPEENSGVFSFCEIAGVWKSYGKTNVIIRKNNLRRV